MKLVRSSEVRPQSRDGYGMECHRNLYGRRGGTRGVRMNGHLCLAEEWLEREGGKESAEPGKDELVLDLGKHPTALAFPRLTSSTATQVLYK